LSPFFGWWCWFDFFMTSPFAVWKQRNLSNS
jgi:hypothetical protein